MRIDSKTFNVVQLGVGFFLLFFAVNAQLAIIEIIVDTKHKEGVVDEHAGYVSSAIIYGLFTFANFVSAPIVEFLGPRWALVCGAITYGIYLAGFFFLNEPFLYISSVLIGIGAAIIWTAQGKYIAINSTKNTSNIHSSLFWGIYQFSLIGSGIFLYFIFKNVKEDNTIEDSTIRLITGVFTVVTAVGIVILGLLRVQQKNEVPIDSDVASEPEMTFTKHMYSTFKLLKTRRMLILPITFIYVGIEISFYSSIFPAAISFTKKISSNSETIMSFGVIAEGLGEATGGILFGALGNISKKLERISIISLGLFVHLLAYVGVYLNFPNDSPLESTTSQGIIKPPNVPIAIICGYLLGFGDACWNTQIFSLLISRYNKKSAEAFSLFFFFQALGTAIAFWYASYLEMWAHMLILVITGILGFFSFFIADKLPSITEEMGESSLNHVD